MRVERVVLEHHRDIAIPREDIVQEAAIEIDLPARDFFQAGDHPERGGLAASGRAQEHDELAVVDGKRHLLDRFHRVKFLAEVLQEQLAQRVFSAVVAGNTGALGEGARRTRLFSRPAYYSCLTARNQSAPRHSWGGGAPPSLRHAEAPPSRQT